MDALLPELAGLDGIERVRVSYLQPAEVRPGLLDAMVAIPEVMPWFDLSFQHASAPLLRRMRRFGGTEAFLGLIDDVRRRSPLAGIRSNVIVGFPGETEAEVDELAQFLTAARLDVVGVFGYSDEDGTEGELLPDKVAAEAIAERVERITDLIEELTAQRAEDRIGESVRVLVEEVDDETGTRSAARSTRAPTSTAPPGSSASPQPRGDRRSRRSSGPRASTSSRTRHDRPFHPGLPDRPQRVERRQRADRAAAAARAGVRVAAPLG